VAVLFGAIYFYGMDSSAPAAAKPIDVRSVVKAANYIITFVGLPWTRSPLLATPGWLAGGILLVVGVMTALHYGILRQPADRLQRIAVGLILFSLGAAVMAAVGRGDLADEVKVPVRYTVLMMPLHAGLVCLVLPIMARYWDAQGMLLRACMIGITVVTLIQQIPAGRAAAKESRAINASVMRFVAGERDGTMSHRVFPDLSVAARIFATIKSHGLYGWMSIPEQKGLAREGHRPGSPSPDPD
jgi:hypothetical protein